MNDRVKKEWLSVYELAAIFIIFSAVIITAGYLYYKNFKQHYRSGVEQQLTAIGKLKAEKLADWRKERLGDVGIFYKNQEFVNLVSKFFDKPEDPDTQKHLQVWFNNILSHANYTRISLLDSRCVERLSFPASSEPADSPIVAQAAEVLQSGQIKFLDFYLCEQDRRIYLAVLVPLLDVENNRQLGVLGLQIDPEIYLYPYIRSWPVTSITAETLLVRRNADKVQFLNQLRFKKDSALFLERSIENKESPAVKAILGQTGIVEGIDYRGVPVIADVRAVPDSPWFLVTRIDVSEVYAQVHKQLWAIIIFIAVLLAGTFTGIGLIWWNQRAIFYREKYKAAKQWEATFDAMTDFVFIIGPDFRLRKVNRAFAALFGKKSEELIGLHCYELVHGTKDLLRIVPAKKPN